MIPFDRRIPTLTDSVGGDGVALISSAHPVAAPLRPWRPPFLRRESLETVEIEIERHPPVSRELECLFAAMASGVEFNEAFDRVKLIRLARERTEDRLARNFVRRRRYLKRHGHPAR